MLAMYFYFELKLRCYNTFLTVLLNPLGAPGGSGGGSGTDFRVPSTEFLYSSD